MTAPSTEPLALALAAWALAGCGSEAAPERAAARPNVIVVSIDTLRPDHLGCYGYERATSPRLDHFAEGALLFEAAQSVSPWTAPALISLMTSLHPEAHGVMDAPDPGRLADGAVTLAEVLSDAGYATGAFTEGGYAKGDFGLEQGFDVYPRNRGDDANHTSNRRFPSRLKSNLERAFAWLEERGSEPFFLFLQTYEPHSPLRAPESYVRRWRPDYDEAADHALASAAIERWNAQRVVDPEGLAAIRRHSYHCEFSDTAFPKDGKALTDASREAGVSIAKGEAAAIPEVVDWFRDLYDAEIRYTDDQLGRLWTWLAESGHGEDTIVVVVSDHGEGLGEHGRMGHGHVLYDELIHILFILRIPALIEVPFERAGRIPDVVRLVDVMPTLLELLALDPGDLPLQGSSLIALLEGRKEPRLAFSHADRSELTELYAVRRGGFRLIYDKLSGERWLYDLTSDPDEERDVAAEHEELADELQSALEAQMEQDAAIAGVLGEGGARGLEEDTRAELEGLGYMGGDEEE